MSRCDLSARAKTTENLQYVALGACHVYDVNGMVRYILIIHPYIIMIMWQSESIIYSGNSV